MIGISADFRQREQEKSSFNVSRDTCHDSRSKV